MAAVVVGASSVRRTETDRLLHSASVALAEERLEDAQQLAETVLERDPTSSSAALIAGWAAARRQRSVEAISFFDRVPPGDDPAALAAELGRAERLLRLGRAGEAEASFRRVLARDPRHHAAARQLAWLLAVQGRTREAKPFYEVVVSHGEFRADELALIGESDRFFVDDATARGRFSRAVPNAPGPKLATARALVNDNEWGAARRTLERVVETHPDLVEAQAVLGELLLKSGTTADYESWLGRLPEHTVEHASIWVVRGWIADDRGEAVRAARCYAEAVSRAPSHAVANFRLARALAAIDREEAAAVFADRSTRLSTMNYLFSELTNGYDPAIVRRLTKHLEALGRRWEALGWYELVLRQEKAHPPAWATDGYARSRRFVLDHAPEFDPVPPELADVDIPAASTEESGPTRIVESESAAVGTNVGDHIRFENVAQDTGLQFDYSNGTTAESGLEHMLQATGGGVAVIDYDTDGWPDLYFTQAYEWPAHGQTRNRNRLFRNVEGTRFEDVTEAAGVGDTGYGQGIAVGDFDNDGDPDLYVCNVGANRLYRNEGNGRFVDVTERAGVAGNEWTTSAVLADFDGDALPDLYVVNYLDLDQVLTRRCKHEGRPMGCAPTMFDAARDRLYLNRGNGRFEDVTEDAGLVVERGKGLGVVAFDLDDSGRLSLFIGNDTTANFLFVNETVEPGKPRFREAGMQSGLALDESGLAQATMGIAVDDADGDGRLDFFATNFYEESNTLYRRLDDSGFEDFTRASRLRDPGFRMLGFGTEFLDADLDGHPDLLVTNGHVDRSFATGAPDSMPPQFFRNLGGGRFGEANADALGGYFSRLFLGRSLAVLDWNRDGLPDACISHIDAPAALLENRTTEHGRHLVVQLEGRRSSRDAYGTRITVTVGDRSWTKQLVAGGGYEVVNERAVTFGLGVARQVDRVRIAWPSGHVDEMTDVEIDGPLRVREGG